MRAGRFVGESLCCKKRAVLRGCSGREAALSGSKPCFTEKDDEAYLIVRVA